ncbi:hypothetical protein Afil01_56540 [Actinorhabdospora filicis]|uniref:Uncharacterized protein n=1 Tax=Actinorhabdospora filicis TaxID=1785913 RepID=A0A9W6SRE9_9ACTN|nr:hypothetical protein [Actinorhabdospora filicis]GLZ80847.1 hypothetical protein Afil01_56540 [Actinorhabdospora filicis]
MRIRRLTVLAVSALLVLTACEATFQDPVLGSPAHAIKEAVKALAKGFEFGGSIETK